MQKIPSLSNFNTTDIKLAALILSEVEGSSFDILSDDPLKVKKIVRVLFPTHLKDEVNTLVSNFINREARVHVFKYNRYLNSLRDKLKEA